MLSAALCISSSDVLLFKCQDDKQASSGSLFPASPFPWLEVPLSFLLVFSPDHKSFPWLQRELGRDPYGIFTNLPTPMKGQARDKEITRILLLPVITWALPHGSEAWSLYRQITESKSWLFFSVSYSVKHPLSSGPTFLLPLSLGFASFEYGTLHWICSGEVHYLHAHHPWSPTLFHNLCVALKLVSTGSAVWLCSLSSPFLFPHIYPFWM